MPPQTDKAEPLTAEELPALLASLKQWANIHRETPIGYDLRDALATITQAQAERDAAYAEVAVLSTAALRALSWLDRQDMEQAVAPPIQQALRDALLTLPAAARALLDELESLRRTNAKFEEAAVFAIKRAEKAEANALTTAALKARLAEHLQARQRPLHTPNLSGEKETVE